MRIDVLGVGFDNLTMAEAVERGMELVRSPGPHYVVTPNPEIVEVCREDSGARAAVNGADLVLPDGIGVIKGAAMLGTPLKERTPGVEFATHLMDKLAEEGKSLYLLGAKPGVAEQAGAKLAAAHPCAPMPTRCSTRWAKASSMISPCASKGVTTAGTKPLSVSFVSKLMRVVLRKRRREAGPWGCGRCRRSGLR